jgi:hypothetical protein
LSTEIALTGCLFPLEGSKLFMFYQMEHHAIDNLKWAESERMGHDCGLNHARWIWVTTERTKWLQGLQRSGILH